MTADASERKYRNLAAEYDRRWSRYIEASHRNTLERLDLAGKERLLDVGCGTGFMLSRLADAHPSLELRGIDACEAMLDVAKSRLGDDRVQRAPASEVPFEAATFDVVITLNMFHYIDAPLAALNEMVRVLRPGGRLVLTDWCDNYLACKVCDLVLRLTSPAHHRTYDTNACADLLTEAGFVDVRVERYRVSWLWGLMTATARSPQ